MITRVFRSSIRSMIRIGKCFLFKCMHLTVCFHILPSTLPFARRWLLETDIADSHLSKIFMVLLLMDVTWKYMVILCFQPMAHLVSETKGSPASMQNLPVGNARGSMFCKRHRSFARACL